MIHLFTVCSENTKLSDRYHSGLWNGKRWSCCRLSTRSAVGCDQTTVWAKNHEALPTDPASILSSTATLITRLGECYNIFGNIWFSDIMC